MKKIILIVSSVLIIGIVVYNYTKPEINFEGMTTEEIIEYISSNDTNYYASASSEELIVVLDSGKEMTFDMPKDKFYISIAPYINETHP